MGGSIVFDMLTKWPDGHEETVAEQEKREALQYHADTGANCTKTRRYSCRPAGVQRQRGSCCNEPDFKARKQPQSVYETQQAAVFAKLKRLPPGQSGDAGNCAPRDGLYCEVLQQRRAVQMPSRSEDQQQRGSN